MSEVEGLSSKILLLHLSEKLTQGEILFESVGYQLNGHPLYRLRVEVPEEEELWVYLPEPVKVDD